MITINLALRKQVSAVGNSKSGGDLSSLTQSGLNGIKTLPIKKITLPLLAGFAASTWLDNYKDQTLAEYQSRLAAIEMESKNIQKEFSKYKELEKVKKSMDDDEHTIRTKLDTIRLLITDRSRTLSGMIALSKTMPDDVWVSEFRLDKSDMNLVGSASDFNQISDFLKKLKEDAFFGSVELRDAQQAESGEMVNFKISMNRSEIK